ncbi:ubiquitin-conjugating enzyme E2 11-like isoform X1 [Tasmannia lanceolata]|uniref:ubiquitin-conjugating enzyme E2 11-like isoform X1 n=1 Tax=Tasmannia lanceolata TaxID=3420 RepID=UPI004062F621
MALMGITSMVGKGQSLEGMAYKVSVSFPIDYPIEPPKVKFKTLCFHPNVDLYGSVCWDILQVFWKLDFMESSVRMRRCLRRNYERSDYLAAAANSGDHLLQLKHHLSYK